jgi:hypothetical protein
MNTMALGGRPKEEEGHKRKKFSLNKKTCKGLEKIAAGERSKLIEKALCPVLRQYDPGESCETLGLVDKILTCEIETTVPTQEYEKVAGLTALANALAPFRDLCNVPSEGDTAMNGKSKPRPIERFKYLSLPRNKRTCRIAVLRSFPSLIARAI